MPALVKRPPITQQPIPNRREKLAINIADLTRLDAIVVALMINHQLDRAGGAIRTDPDRMDEGAVVFSCDILTAACICDTLREHDRRAGDYPTRVYLQRSRGGAWTKLPGQVTLTRVVGNTVELDPELFPPEVHAADLVAPTITPVMM